MTYLGPVRSIINAHVQCYVRPVPLVSLVLLNPAGDNVEYLSCQFTQISINIDICMMAACHAETTISLKMDSELEESCMYFYSLWSLSTGLISAHFLCFWGKKYRVWHEAHSQF